MPLGLAVDQRGFQGAPLPSECSEPSSPGPLREVVVVLGVAGRRSPSRRGGDRIRLLQEGPDQVLGFLTGARRDGGGPDDSCPVRGVRDVWVDRLWRRRERRLAGDGEPSWQSGSARDRRQDRCSVQAGESLHFFHHVRSWAATNRFRLLTHIATTVL